VALVLLDTYVLYIKALTTMNISLLFRSRENEITQTSRFFENFLGYDFLRRNLSMSIIPKLSVKFITICKIMSYIIIFLAISSIPVIIISAVSAV